MIFCIIITLLFFAFFVLVAITSDNAKEFESVGTAPFVAFVLMLLVTIAGCSNARENKALYNDMAKNPQCYSVNDLKEAHKAIQGHKAHQGHWTSFYNGYNFPEINVYVMDEVDHTLHVVK